MAIFTLLGQGKAGLATVIKERDDIFFGIGDFGGSPPIWTDVPAPVNPDTTSLISLKALKRYSVINYIVEDEFGNIFINNKTYKTSLTPTNLLHIRCVFAANEAAGYNICQFGIYIKSELASSVTPGQSFIPIDQIVSPGILMLLSNKKLETVLPDRQLILETVLRF